MITCKMHTLVGYFDKNGEENLHAIQDNSAPTQKKEL